jgi:hypothetical protein
VPLITSKEVVKKQVLVFKCIDPIIPLMSDRTDNKIVRDISFQHFIVDS